MLTRSLIPLAKVDDVRLVARCGAGDAAAFSALYDRHHASLLAFCRHMLGNRQDGEDALQQTFIRAHQAMLRGQRPDEPCAWLFAIARNRCRTMLASRRDTVDDGAEQLEGVCVDGLTTEAQQRAELRDLLADMSKLPEDQRAALLLTELRGFTHEQIARVIDCPATKVKALVFQARSHLLAEREARDTECVEIRQRLEVARGGELRRGLLRRHLRRCDPCRAYSVAVSAQRTELAGLLVVLPSAGLKLSVLGAVGLAGAGADGVAGGAAAAAGVAAGSGATTGIGGVSAGTAAGVATKVALIKVAAVLAVGGMAAGGAAATVDRGGQRADRTAGDRGEIAGSRATPIAATAAGGPGTGARGAAVAAGSPSAGQRRGAKRRTRAGARVRARARARIRRRALRRARARPAITREATPAIGARLVAPATPTGGARRVRKRDRSDGPPPADRRPAGARPGAGAAGPGAVTAAPGAGTARPRAGKAGKTNPPIGKRRRALPANPSP